MTVYSENFEKIIENPDLSKGHLVKTTRVEYCDNYIETSPINAYQTCKNEETGAIYNRPLKSKEDCYIYVAYSESDLNYIEYKDLREQRQKECFDICDRACWYDSLTDEQKVDVKKWREAWLDVTNTGVIPEKPAWMQE